LLIIIPILLLVLVTAANRFKQGTKWLLLRAGADAIRREIYLYRSRARYYRDQAEQHLSEKLADITRKTMQTEVSATSLKPYNKERGFPPGKYAAPGRDDGFSYLTSDRYVEWRLSEQLRFFKKRAVQLEKQLKWLYWLTYIIGGLGAYLAAVNQQVWIALTTSLVAAMGVFMGYRQTENSLLQSNRAVTDLANIKAWWHGLSAEEQTQQPLVDSLIGHTENVLQAAREGAIPRLQDELADLRPAPVIIRPREALKPSLFADPARYRSQLRAAEKKAAEDFNPDYPYPAPATNGLPLNDARQGEESLSDRTKNAAPPAPVPVNGANVPYPEEVASSQGEPGSLAPGRGNGTG
jgi:hypothetical protein